MRNETKAAQKRREKAEAVAYLREIIAPGATVYATVRTVSRSGMSRRIDLYTICGDSPADGGRPWLVCFSGMAARVLGWPVNDDGVRVNGCGMDMRFHLVDCLSRALFGHPERQADGTLAPQPLHAEGF